MTQRVTARCDACGTNWKVEVDTEKESRGECPYCGNGGDLKLDKPYLSLVQLPDVVSRRWL